MHQTIVNLRLLSLANRSPRRRCSRPLVHRFDWQLPTPCKHRRPAPQARFGKLFAAWTRLEPGRTREVAEAYQIVTTTPSSTLRCAARRPRGGALDSALWSAYLELDYASGDGDPQVRTALTQFVFAEDANVGLLLFEHVLGSSRRAPPPPAPRSARLAASPIRSRR